MARLRLRETHTKKQIRLSKIREEQSRETAKHEERLEGRMEALPAPSSSTSQAALDMKKKRIDVSEGSLKITFSVEEYYSLDDEQREQKWL